VPRGCRTYVTAHARGGRRRCESGVPGAQRHRRSDSEHLDHPPSADPTVHLSWITVGILIFAIDCPGLPQRMLGLARGGLYGPARPVRGTCSTLRVACWARAYARAPNLRLRGGGHAAVTGPVSAGRDRAKRGTSATTSDQAARPRRHGRVASPAPVARPGCAIKLVRPEVLGARDEPTPGRPPALRREAKPPRS
jgi:hypothetical protein